MSDPPPTMRLWLSNFVARVKLIIRADLVWALLPERGSG